MKKSTVFVALSGGVDSAVAAYLLKQQGYEVVAVTMDFGVGTGAAAATARAVAEHLGIPHLVWDLRREFEESVVSYFCREYLAGRTPNPCVVCNREIKFGVLLARARAHGAAFLATGHYARVAYDASRGRWLLRRGKDLRKDQSYVLALLRQDQLASLLLPLGEYTKEEVRKIAAAAGIPAAARESQEICFVSGDYREFLKARCGAHLHPGPIYDVAGRFLGTHRGLAFYTIGQRRGLGLARGRPLYVVGMDPRKNALIVGSAGDLYASGLVARDVNFVSGDAITTAREVLVKIRATAPAVPAVVAPGKEAGEVEVRFLAPQQAVTPGQLAVFYEGEVVLGGGFITRSLPRAHFRGAAGE